MVAYSLQFFYRDTVLQEFYYRNGSFFFFKEEIKVNQHADKLCMHIKNRYMSELIFFVVYPKAKIYIFVREVPLEPKIKSVIFIKS